MKGFSCTNPNIKICDIFRFHCICFSFFSKWSPVLFLVIDALHSFDLLVFLSVSALYDTDVGWLLNTLLCMFYEYDCSNSTSEVVVCQWSLRICTPPDFTSAWRVWTLQHFKRFSWFLFLYCTAITWTSEIYISSRSYIFKFKFHLTDQNYWRSSYTLNNKSAKPELWLG